MGDITRLKLATMSAGLTQRQLAKAARLNEATVSLIANGRYKPSTVQKAKLADALKRPMDELFPGDDLRAA